jgi:acyl-CoA thioesterase-1
MKCLYGSKITVVLIIGLVFGITADITDAKVVACVGASITEGYSLSAEDAYPAQLQEVLRQYDGGWEVRNFGVSGAVVIRNAPLTAYIDTNAYKLALACEPDIVVIQLGGNDSLPGMWAHKASFFSDFIVLIDAFVELPSQPLIFIWLPTPIFSSPYGHNNNVVKNEIIPLIRQLPAQRDVHLIDLYTPFEDKAHLFPDGIHPNTEGAGLIAEIVAAAIINFRMPPDFNDDGIVDAADMCMMIDYWGTDEPMYDIAPPPYGDGLVDVEDLILLADHLFEGAGLVAHWALDETEGDIAYDSAGNLDATVHNGQWKAGKIDGALDFDGLTTYMDCGDSLRLGTQKMTVSMWLEPQHMGGMRYVLSRARERSDEFDYFLMRHYEDQVEFALAQEGSQPVSVMSNGTTPLNEWTHVAVSVDGSEAKIYINGQLDASAGYGQRVSREGFRLLISSLGADTRFYNGKVDDVRIYNIALSAEEIEELAQ